MWNRRKVEVGSWFRGAWNKNPTRKYRREPPSFASVFLTAFSCRGASIARHLPQPCRNLVRVEHERVFERRAERHRGDVGAGDPADRGIQAGKAALSELSRDLRAESTRAVGLVNDRHAPGFLDRAHAGLDIPGAERAQVDHLHLDAIPTQPGGRLPRPRPT